MHVVLSTAGWEQTILPLTVICLGTLIGIWIGERLPKPLRIVAFVLLAIFGVVAWSYAQQPYFWPCDDAWWWFGWPWCWPTWGF